MLHLDDASAAGITLDNERIAALVVVEHQPASRIVERDVDVVCAGQQ
jgi:hypothetical protein